jgi:hypothetical protein
VFSPPILFGVEGRNQRDQARQTKNYSRQIPPAKKPQNKSQQADSAEERTAPNAAACFAHTMADRKGISPLGPGMYGFTGSGGVSM